MTVLVPQVALKALPKRFPKPLQPTPAITSKEIALNEK